MKILTTGGAGYLGSVLVEELIKAGYPVTVLDNFMYRQASLNHLCGSKFFDVVRGDCRDPDVMRPLLAKHDVLIPLAALVGAPMCAADRYGAASTNFEAVEMATKIMSPHQRIIIPITNSGYGIGAPGVDCTEDTSMRPISHYGQTKCDAERVVLDRGNAISLRLATVFGPSPRMRIDLLLNEFVWRASTDRSIVLFEADNMRNFCHVRDAAGAFVHALNNFDLMKDQIYNVGDSRANMSKRQLCERIKKHIPDFHFFEAALAEDPDKRDYLVSNRKIEMTGWMPARSIDDGIEDLIKLYRCFGRHQFGNV